MQDIRAGNPHQSIFGRRALRVHPSTLRCAGLDNDNLNAPDLASIAEGVWRSAMITVHGRTRASFYKGTANWACCSLTRQNAVRFL